MMELDYSQACQDCKDGKHDHMNAVEEKKGFAKDRSEFLDSIDCKNPVGEGQCICPMWQQYVSSFPTKIIKWKEEESENNPNQITREMYRDALHIYLKHAFPEDDCEYYSQWAWLVPSERFWQEDLRGDFPFPTEVRFGCHVSGNTKLRCYETGFMFDTNHSGDPPEIVAEVKRLKNVIEDEWDKHGIPLHSKRFDSDG